MGSGLRRDGAPRNRRGVPPSVPPRRFAALPGRRTDGRRDGEEREYSDQRDKMPRREGWRACSSPRPDAPASRSRLVVIHRVHARHRGPPSESRSIEADRRREGGSSASGGEPYLQPWAYLSSRHGSSSVRDPDGRRAVGYRCALSGVGYRGALRRGRGTGDIRLARGVREHRAVPARAAAVLGSPPLGVAPQRGGARSEEAHCCYGEALQLARHSGASQPSAT